MDEMHASILYTETVGCLFAFMTISGYTCWPIFKEPFRRINDGDDISQLNRKVQLIFPDRSYPEEFSTPSHVHNAWDILLSREQLPKGSNNYTKYVDLTFCYMHHTSGQPNEYEDMCPTPYPYNYSNSSSGNV